MASILYYSNYCDNCKKLLGVLSQNKVKEEVHYVCIDRRTKESNGATYIILENNQKILLPPTVTKVPALLLMTQGHHVLFGDQIYQHLQPRENNFSQIGQLTHLFKTCESMCRWSENLGSATSDNATLVHGPDTILTSGNGAVRAKC